MTQATAPLAWARACFSGKEVVPRETRAILPFDDRAAEQYADVLVAREQAGLPIHTGDAQIAAICRAYGATCATRNSKDFTGTGVELVDPWAT